MRNKILIEISQLMQEVQNATQSDSNLSLSQDDYIQDVNNRIGEIEVAIATLKYELTKHGLNDW